MLSEIDEKLFAAISDQDIAQVRDLLARGANPSAINKYGESALMEACDSWYTAEVGHHV